MPPSSGWPNLARRLNPTRRRYRLPAANGALRPATIELGPSSDSSEVHVNDGVERAAAQPAVPPRIPAQAISTRTVRQKPVSAPVDEIAPMPQSVQSLRHADRPAEEVPVSSGLPATEPLPADIPASAASPSGGPDANRAAAGRMQYPHYSGHTDSPDGFEMLPVAPLPGHNRASGTSDVATRHDRTAASGRLEARRG